ncbi:hypothetical protein BQ8794_60315 [Mesorhizobium prunaredense]|uniref:Uncharacterized protein n=1 Tax=Mesorhizobium prunaredense TaxID=1631249 RepID=A0A1R3VJF4_9HYPH|nr:hypothetical protein BQ8794_60315 [Mesorhizobium prunaredense]
MPLEVMDAPNFGRSERPLQCRLLGAFMTLRQRATAAHLADVDSDAQYILNVGELERRLCEVRKSNANTAD